MLAVNDMYNLSQENVWSLFKEDVELFFKSHDLVFSKDIKVSGKSGFDHNIDFLIPAYNKRPERLIKAINVPNKNSIMSAIFSFNDIEEVRETETLNFVVYNDMTNRSISGDSLSALGNYGIESIGWKNKEECLEKFALR